MTADVRRRTSSRSAAGTASRSRCAPIREYAGEITAVVSVADDGGSLGPAAPRPRRARARRPAQVPRRARRRRRPVARRVRAPLRVGRARRPRARQPRASSASPRRSAISTARARRGRAACSARSAGCCPATLDPVVDQGRRRRRARDRARSRSREAGERGRIRGVRLVPADAPACPDALDAIARADQIVLAPGLALHEHPRRARACPRSGPRSAGAPGRVVQVAQPPRPTPETAGLDGTDQLAGPARARRAGSTCSCTIREHGLAVERDCGAGARGRRRSRPIIAAADGRGHDPAKLATALAALL